MRLLTSRSVPVSLILIIDRTEHVKEYEICEVNGYEHTDKLFTK